MICRSQIPTEKNTIPDRLVRACSANTCSYWLTTEIVTFSLATRSEVLIVGTRSSKLTNWLHIRKCFQWKQKQRYGERRVCLVCRTKYFIDLLVCLPSNCSLRCGVYISQLQKSCSEKKRRERISAHLEELKFLLPRAKKEVKLCWRKNRVLIEKPLELSWNKRVDVTLNCAW